MKTRALFLSALMILMSVGVSSAQLGNILRNKASKVINAGAQTFHQQVSNKVDSAAQAKVQTATDSANQKIDRSTNQVQQAGQNASTQASKGFNIGGLMGGKVTSKYNDSYSFTSRIYMEMDMHHQKDKETKMDYYLYFTKSDPVVGVETQIEGTSDQGNQVAVNSSIVIDGNNKSYIILSNINGMKMGMISAIPDETTQTQTQTTDNSQKPVFTKTGNTKVIAGYKCDEYTYQDPKVNRHGSLWLTKDLTISGDNRSFSKAGLSYYGNADLGNGTVLAMEQYNEKNELEVSSTTKEVDLSYSHSISITGYTLRQMNFNQGAGQQKK
ncbi:MAG: hypothetical protein ABSG89_00445 [Bacteroidales bacterium]|jgi:hypothetical protein